MPAEDADLISLIRVICAYPRLKNGIQNKNAFRSGDKRKAERQQINALASRIIVVNS